MGRDCIPSNAGAAAVAVAAVALVHFGIHEHTNTQRCVQQPILCHLNTATAAQVQDQHTIVYYFAQIQAHAMHTYIGTQTLCHT